jgi:hypothetical protein
MTRTARRLEGNVGKYGGGDSIIIHDIRRELIHVASFRDFSIFIPNDKNFVTLFSKTLDLEDTASMI